MKMYEVRNKRGELMFRKFASKQEAVEVIMDYIGDFNDELADEYYESDYITPFDFTIKEVEEREVNERVVDYESANSELNNNDSDLKHIRVNKKHKVALIALNELFTIAEAWNKADDFTPDWSNLDQDKWYPWFVYDADRAGFLCAYTYHSPSATHAAIGSRLCFKTAERARQFGKQFIDLWNEVLLIK